MFNSTQFKNHQLTQKCDVNEIKPPILHTVVCIVCQNKYTFLKKVCASLSIFFLCLFLQHIQLQQDGQS